MRVSDLYAPKGPFVGEDIYIVGLGPSMKQFPKRALEGRICLLLNDAHRIFPKLGPVAFANHDSFIKDNHCEHCELGYRLDLSGTIKELKPCKRCDGTGMDAAHPNACGENIKYRICRGRFAGYALPCNDDNAIPWHDPGIYVFSFRHNGYRDSPDEWNLHDDRALWAEPCHYWSHVGGTVAEFAVQFAAYAGARTIFLVGVDCASVKGVYYCDTGVEEDRMNRAIGGKKGRQDGGLRDEKTYKRERQFGAYREGLNRLRKEVDQKFGIPIVSLSPFIGLGQTK